MRRRLWWLPAVLLGAGLAGPSLYAQPTPGGEPPQVGDEPGTAIFAGGCFWCMEADFEKLAGVKEAISGYAGGELANPSYKQVTGGGTGHAEVVRVHYDPGVVDSAGLVAHFWKNVEPTTPNRQFCDSGSQYRAALMPLNPEQRRIAEASRQRVVDSGRFPAVHVSIEEPGHFWRAEEYHQDYYREHAIRYRFYRSRCGRDDRLEQLWGEPKED